MTYDPTLQLDQRKHVPMTMIVELACCLPSIRDAANYLAHHSVPITVARRVLLQPHLRRRST